MIKSKKEAKPSKASVARDFMKKIGAFTKNPPEGWADKVESHLKEQGFPIPASNKVQIYAIRSEAMKKESKASRSNSAKPSSNHRKTKRKAPGTVHQVTIEELSTAKKYAAANGGVTRCLEALRTLQALSLD